MPRIILFADGTGNGASAFWRTNVRRLFEGVDLRGSDQVAFYDDGVGTSSFRPAAILGSACGWGLKRNVLDLYKSVCRNYEGSADEIFAFGFSRGAFTIRVVIGLMLNQGLVKFNTEADLSTKALAAYRAYRREKFHSVHRFETLLRWFRDLFVTSSYDKSQNREVHEICFLGLWDTVAAYGLPMDEMTRGVSQWLWPLELPDRCLSPKVKRACHAISLDDERTTFHPVLWDESEGQIASPRGQDGNGLTKHERITQVWFAGAHANVGGGYPDDTLAHITLYWIMEEARECGLKLKVLPDADPDVLVHTKSIRDKDGRIYDPRQGLGGYYRYGPRKVFDLCHTRLSRNPGDKVEIALPKIHESVLKRVRDEVNPYSPIGLPPTYEVVDDERRILAPINNPYETIDEAVNRARAQEKVWNYVWARRLVYFLAVFTSFYLVLYPLSKSMPPEWEYGTMLRPVSDTIAIVGAFLPDALNVWKNAYRRDPGRFIATLVVLWSLISLGSYFRSKINDQMRTIWRTRPIVPAPRDLIYLVRTNCIYRWLHNVSKRHILPFIFAVAIAYILLAASSHVIFNFLDAGGYFCRPSLGAEVLKTSQTKTFSFDTSSICNGSGVVLEEGGRYRLSIKQIGKWQDDNIVTNLAGFYITDLPIAERVLRTVAWPLKRALIRPWFRPIARIGSRGTDEEFLDPDISLSVSAHEEIIRPRQTGELYLYVNDAVVSLPRLWEAFYRDNVGIGEITIVRLR
jgi:uncharacterized protein (DUF2235 family)